MLPLVAVIAVGAGPLAPAPVSAAPDPVSCTGYPEPRQFFETQAWWEPVPNLEGQGHVHLGMCWPHAQTVSGTLKLDLRVLLHDNRGTLTRVKVQDDYSNDFNFFESTKLDSSQGELTAWRSISIDTTKINDGMRQLRIYAYFSHEGGNEQIARAHYMVDVENGKTDYAAKYSEYGGSGWYLEEEDGTDWGYQRATLDRSSFLAIGQCVSGTWQPRVKLAWSSPSASEHMVLVDPNIHAGSLGKVIRQGSGGYDGTVSIDTRTLTNGTHKLFVQSGRRVGVEENGGVFVYPFTVCN